MLTSVGWCAGRPADHDLDDERAVAARLLSAYRHTTAVRDFRGSSVPSSSWWTTQTLGAVGEHWTPGDLPVDVVLSWNSLTAPVSPLLETIPEWVGKIYLLGQHEPELKITPEQHFAQFRLIRTEINAFSLNKRVHLGPAYVLYRARITAPVDTERYVIPLVREGLIDFIAWDGYPSNPAEAQPTNPEEYEDPDAFSAVPRSWSNRTGLPYAWAELHHKRLTWDFAGLNCADWHAGVYRAARADNARFVTQFHYNHGDFLR